MISIELFGASIIAIIGMIGFIWQRLDADYKDRMQTISNVLLTKASSSEVEGLRDDLKEFKSETNDRLMDIMRAIGELSNKSKSKS
jgi:hypothetical protein